MIEIAGIRKESFEDGLGIRTVIYVQGCNHNCYNCQNPDTHKKGEGQLVTLQYLLNIIDQDVLSIGVTFSGGCPMCEPSDELVELAKQIKLRGKNLWLYCGEKLEELEGSQLELLKYVDVLVDGKYNDKLKDDTLPFRGSSNQRIIEMKERNNCLI